MPMFQCPSCNAQVQVGEDFAGKRIVCPQCQQSGPVPASADATPQGITTPDLAHATPRRRADDDLPEAVPSIRDPDVRGGPRAWLTLGKVLVAVSMCVIGTIVLAFLPTVRRGRDDGTRFQEANNLKNIGLAMHSFHDANRRFPFNGSDIAVGGEKYSKAALPSDPRSGSWAFQILPYMDQAPLFLRIDQTRSVAAYVSPTRGRPNTEQEGGAWSDYFFNNYLNNPNEAAKPDAADMGRTLVSITDGASNTIIVGQGSIDTRQYSSKANVAFCTNIFVGGTFGTARGGNNGAVAPGGVTLQRDSAAAPTAGSWGGPLAQGAIMCMGDATVRMFPYNTNNFSAFLTPTGREVVVLPDS